MGEAAFLRLAIASSWFFYASHYDYLRAMGVPGAREVQCDVQDPRFKSFSSSAMLGAACLVVSPASLLIRWLLRKATCRVVQKLWKLVGLWHQLGFRALL